jgi:hypothetical protein
MVIYAAVLISLMILRPEGLFGERELIRRGRQKKPPPAAAGAPDEPVPAATVAETQAEAETSADERAEDAAEAAADAPEAAAADAPEAAAADAPEAAAPDAPEAQERPVGRVPGESDEKAEEDALGSSGKGEIK